MYLTDPTTGITAEVNSERKLRTYGVMEPELAHRSERNRNSYVWTASKDINATDSIIWLRNDSTTQRLHIYCIDVNSNVAGSWFIYCPTGTIADGDAITGVNLNRQSGKVALATCRADATGTTPANYIFYGSSMASQNLCVPFLGSLILGYLDEVAVDITTEATVLAQASILGYFVDNE